MRYVLIYIFILITTQLFGQKHQFEFDGQLSIVGNYSPMNDLDVFLGGRYLPELNYGYRIDSTRKFDIEASANISGSLLFRPFDTLNHDGSISPYRFWARYSSKQFELRLGLQKIDFGTAQLLRPIQWFNQIDPRDPLQLTNGVYGALGRYYFKNNANIWLWCLYGNDKPRGVDAFKTSSWEPELGARVQLPIPKGEIAASYHFRNISSEDIYTVPAHSHIPESRIGIDAKWDVKIGLWVEASHIYKARKLLGPLNNQTLLTGGLDYTFGIGNGLGVVVEHMVTTYDTDPFRFENTSQITSCMLTYPLGFFDNLSLVAFGNWDSGDFSFLLNYQHDFKYITGYVMVYYNPTVNSAFIQNNLINSFEGPGIRLMAVFNH